MSTELKPMEKLKESLPELTKILSLNSVEGVDVATMALQELEFLRMHALSKPEIMECIPDTVVMAVKRVLKQNLTMDPYAGLVYVKTRGIKIGNDWKKVLEITESCNGLLSVNYQCGKIKDHTTPTVKKDDNGMVISVSFKYQRASGIWEERTFDESDFMRWRRASHKENGRYQNDANTPEALEVFKYANENYTNWKSGIDPEFARAKSIRHALKKLGTNPNEGKFAKIIIPAEKQVIIEESKDSEASNDDKEFTSAEVIESNVKDSGMKPNDKFNVKGSDL